MNEKELDIVIERLLSGETPEAVARDYPLAREEVLSHARMFANFSSFKNQTPNTEGLRLALSSVRAQEAVRKATPSPFAFIEFSHTSIYRAVFVIPLLFIVVAASGAFFYPWNKAHAPTADVAANPENGAVSSDQASTFSQSADMSAGNSPSPMAKAMSFQATQEPVLMPEDQELSNVFAQEITGDNEAVDEDASMASTATDDTSAVEPYGNVYDAESF